MNALTALQPQLSLSLGDWLADLAVDALIDEADLSPKPGLVDRRGSGAHTDLHLGLMHASALACGPVSRPWPRRRSNVARSICTCVQT